MLIDTAFDFRTDSNHKDPDSHSATLRKYHQFLWSKDLPTTGTLILDDNLDNTSDVGEFHFASDSIIHCFEYWNFYQHIIQQIDPKVINLFVYKSYTIAGMLIFPRNKVNGKVTINSARGMNTKIRDRIDLTLECIRRYYLGENSPLFDCLARYDSFFQLFGCFQGYIDFFLMNDMIDVDGNIRFLHPFEEFGKNILPASPEEYMEYYYRCIEFINSRSRRIEHFCSAAMI